MGRMRVVLGPREVMIAAVERAARQLGVEKTFRGFEPAVVYRPGDFPTLQIRFVDGYENRIDVRIADEPARCMVRLGETHEADGFDGPVPEPEIPY